MAAQVWPLPLLILLLLLPLVAFSSQRIIYGGNIPVAQTQTPTPAPTPTPSPPALTSTVANSTSKSASVAAIGAAVGITAATTLGICLLLFCLYIRFANSRRDPPSPSVLWILKKPSRVGTSDSDDNPESQRRRWSSSMRKTPQPQRQNSNYSGPAETVVEIQAHTVPPSAPAPVPGPPAPAADPEPAPVLPPAMIPPPLPPRPPPVPPIARPAPPPPPAPAPPPRPAGRGSGPAGLPRGRASSSSSSSSSSLGRGGGSGASKSPTPGMPRLKPFHWDKLKANAEHSMVWHNLNNGSFRVDEEMMEALFGYGPSRGAKTEVNKPYTPPRQYRDVTVLLDPRKSQNFAIMLRALGVTKDEVYAALLEGDGFNIEFLEKVVKFTLTAEEEAKIQAYKGDISTLGPTERFLKALLEIPFAFRRFDAMLLKATFEDEVEYIVESFSILEAACAELRGGRLFLKLLEAVLKTGNRMNAGTNRGGAQAFNLNALSRLSDVKGKDGTTTLLHFVVQEIIRSEGRRLAKSADQSKQTYDAGSKEELDERKSELGLQAVSGLSNELDNVKKSAGIDADALSVSISRLGDGLAKLKELLADLSKINSASTTVAVEGVEIADSFCKSIEPFVKEAEEKLKEIQNGEQRVIAAVKKITAYYNAEATTEKSRLFNIFVIVKDFLVMLDAVCVEIGNSQRRSSKSMGRESPSSGSSPTFSSYFKNLSQTTSDEDNESD